MEYTNIGGVKIEKTAALAPMASVADRAYRIMAKEYGACYVVGEMASCKGLCYNDRKTAELLSVTPGERPMAVQLFGNEPEFVKGAVEIAAHVPVTVKIRAGWDENSINAVEIAKIAEQSGAAAVAVHGRTKTQLYAGKADWDVIRAVKQSVSIPVIGNGDVSTPELCREMYEYTGCDLVMVGRGSYGRPWLFRQIREYLEAGSYSPEPTAGEKLDIMRRHIRLIVEDKGERVGMKEARRPASWYLKGMKGAAKFRDMCSELTTLDELERLIEKIKEQQGEHENEDL